MAEGHPKGESQEAMSKVGHRQILNIKPQPVLVGAFLF